MFKKTADTHTLINTAPWNLFFLLVEDIPLDFNLSGGFRSH